MKIAEVVCSGVSFSCTENLDSVTSIKMGGGCGDWMELAQDGDRWRALVSTVMNLRVPKMRGIS